MCACVRACARVCVDGCVCVCVFQKNKRERTRVTSPVKGLWRGRMKSLLESNGVRSL